MTKSQCIYDFQLLENEQLKEIPGFPNYKASTEGRIFSYINPDRPRLLQPGTTKGGYQQVVLMQDGRRVTRKVARLVAMTWIPNPEFKTQVDHIIPISEGGTDSVENLRWCTPSENSRNRITYEKLKTRLQKMAVERSFQVFVYTKDYTQVSAFTSTSNAAQTLNYNQGNISSCCQGSLPTYKSLIWSYDPELTEEKREELVAKNRDKFIKNRLSTTQAMKRYLNRPENLAKSRKKALNYYYNHKEEIKAKHKEWYEREKQRRKEGTA